MIISFFEEFPTKGNLEKLGLVTWPTKLYIAAKSLKEFNKIKIKNKNVKGVVYWPILEKKEGYWISPYSKRSALKRVLGEIKDTPTMIDAELPTTKNPWLYLTQKFNFGRNRTLIRKFILNHPNSYVAEYYPTGKFKESIMSFFGLHFDPKKYKCKVIKMIYHSMHKFDEEFITQKLKDGKEEFGNKFIVSFGTIAIGIQGNEPILSKEQLKKDLELAKDAGIKEVIIFRLGGLNKEYVDVIKNLSF